MIFHNYIALEQDQVKKDLKRCVAALKYDADDLVHRPTRTYNTEIRPVPAPLLKSSNPICPSRPPEPAG